VVRKENTHNLTGSMAVVILEVDFIKKGKDLLAHSMAVVILVVDFSKKGTDLCC